jgi:hypothetical protein
VDPHLLFPEQGKPGQQLIFSGASSRYPLYLFRPRLFSKPLQKKDAVSIGATPAVFYFYTGLMSMANPALQVNGEFFEV